MNPTDHLERELAVWMEAVAPRRAPEDLVRTVAERTRGLRPRPRWLARLQELPMQTQLSLRRGRVLGVPATLLLVGLLALALVAGALFIGAQLLQRRALPAPFGVAANGLIAVEVDGTIVTVRPDGTRASRVDLPWTGVSGVSFSRDGTRFAGWVPADSRFTNDQRRLVLANVDGTSAMDVAPDVISGPSARIAWSPDDRRLAFSDAGDRLLIADLDARSIREVGEPGLLRRDPAWSPDGRLSYRCAAVESRKINLCTMNGDGTGEQVVPGISSGTDWAHQGSAWSHKGDRLVYYIDAVDGTGGWDVAAFDFGTGTERILTGGTAEHTIYPVWTPDDRYVLFITGVVRPDGSDLRTFSDLSCEFLVEPSPDGRYLTCVVEDAVVMQPLEGGERISIPLGAAGASFSWQRVAR